MRAFHCSLGIVCLLLAASLAFAAEPLTLVKDGVPTSTIIIAADATKSAQLAAYELQHHLQLITGATVPIVTDQEPASGTLLLVGPSAATTKLGIEADFKPQEYLLKFLPNAVVMMGDDKDDRGKVDYSATNPNRCATWPRIWDALGTLYAEDDFLQKYCGVRWFNPTDLGTVVPHRRTLTITPGPELRRSPVFTNRGLWTYDPAALDDSTRLWKATSPEAQALDRMSHPEIYARYPQGNGMERRSRNQLFLFRQKLGGEEFLANHTLHGWVRRFHRKFPGLEEVFEEEHRDWFAQGWGDVPSEPCLSNKEFLAQVVSDARAYFDHGTRKYGYQAYGQKYFAIVPDDDSNWCKCAACQAQMRPDRTEDGINAVASDYIWGFVNEVAKATGKTNPGTYISALAYASYQGRPSFKLEPNVVVDMCLSTRNWWSPATKKADMRMLTEWKAEKGKRPMYCWVYWTFPLEVANNSGFKAFPGFFAHTAAEQYRILLDHGIRGMFYCGIGQDVENYVAAQMMDNPDLDVDVLLDDFFNLQYGKAGPALRKFYEAVEATYSNPNNYPDPVRTGEVGIHQNRAIAWKWLGTPERMAKFAEYIAEADAAPCTSLQRRRVEIFKLSYWDYMQAGLRETLAREALPIPKLTIPRVAPAGGDATQAEWSRAAALTEFYKYGSDTPASRKLSARMVHDGEYLYLRLEDPCPTDKLNVSPTVACYDDWEIFSAGQRALPYRQLMVGPTGMTAGTSNGEVNWRMYMPWTEHGARVKSDTSAPDLWTEWVAIPLKNLTPEGVKPGATLYLNVVRVTGPRITGGGVGIDCPLTFNMVHEPDRMPEVTLAP